MRKKMPDRRKEGNWEGRRQAATWMSGHTLTVHGLYHPTRSQFPARLADKSTSREGSSPPWTIALPDRIGTTNTSPGRSLAFPHGEPRSLYPYSAWTPTIPHCKTVVAIATKYQIWCSIMYALNNDSESRSLCSYSYRLLATQHFTFSLCAFVL
jgi:hypothetical protein